MADLKFQDPDPFVVEVSLKVEERASKADAPVYSKSLSISSEPLSSVGCVGLDRVSGCRSSKLEE